VLTFARACVHPHNDQLGCMHFPHNALSPQCIVGTYRCVCVCVCSYVDKLTEFLRLSMSVHWPRFERSPQFPVVDFLAVLFHFTFQQVCTSLTYFLLSENMSVDHRYLLLIYDPVLTQCHHVATMQYKCVLNSCIAHMYSCAYGTFTAEAENSPLCKRQHGIRQANPRFACCIIRIIEVNTRCATSDVNPFKICCNLQISKATINES